MWSRYYFPAYAQVCAVITDNDHDANLTPQVRSTDTSAQAMDVGRDGSRGTQFAVCIAAAAD